MCALAQVVAAKRHPSKGLALVSEAWAELPGVKVALIKNCSLLYLVFRHYTSHSTPTHQDSAFNLDTAAFKRFVKDNEILANRSKFCTMDHLLDIFMASGLGYYAQVCRADGNKDITNKKKERKKEKRKL